METKRDKHSLYTLGNLGITTKDWEEYEFDSQFKRGKSYRLKVLDSFVNGNVKNSALGVERKEQLSIAHHMRKKYGKNAIIVLEPVEDYVDEGQVLVTEDEIVDSEERLNNTYRLVLKDICEKIRSNMYEHKDYIIYWAVKRDGSIIVKDINWEVLQ